LPPDVAWRLPTLAPRLAPLNRQPPGRSRRQQPAEHGRIGAGHVDKLRPARCPSNQRDRVMADTERGGHRGQGGRCGLSVHGTLADPDDQDAS
jgi:hypothetical protein